MRAVLTVFEVIEDEARKFVAKVVHVVEDAVGFAMGILRKVGTTQ